MLRADGSRLPGLHAAGEVTGGVHGNNRLMRQALKIAESHSLAGRETGGVALPGVALPGVAGGVRERGGALCPVECRGEPWAEATAAGPTESHPTCDGPSDHEGLTGRRTTSVGRSGGLDHPEHLEHLAGGARGLEPGDLLLVDEDLGDASQQSQVVVALTGDADDELHRLAVPLDAVGVADERDRRATDRRLK